MKKIRGFFRGLSKGIRAFLFVGVLLSVLIGTVALFSPTTVYALINRVVGTNVIPGWGVLLDNDSTEVNITEVWTDSLWKMVYEMIDTTAAPIPFSDSTDLITHDRIRDWHFADDDWGDLTVTTNVVTIDNGVVEAADLKNEDFGDFTVAAGVATLDANVVATGEITDQTIVKADIDTTSTFVFGAAYHITSATSDSMFMSKTYIDAAAGGGAMHDSLWTFDQFYEGFDWSFRTGSDAGTEVTIYDNLANDSAGHFVRHIHTGTTAGKIDTGVASCKLPLGMDATGVDSVTYNIRTSHVADSVYVQIKVWKRTTETGALVFCDSVAATATTAGAWEHKTTGALAVAANAGNELEVWVIVTFPSQTANIVLADYKKPRAYYTGR